MPIWNIRADVVVRGKIELGLGNTVRLIYCRNPLTLDFQTLETQVGAFQEFSFKIKNQTPLEVYVQYGTRQSFTRLIYLPSKGSVNLNIQAHQVKITGSTRNENEYLRAYFHTFKDYIHEDVWSIPEAQLKRYQQYNEADFLHYMNEVQYAQLQHLEKYQAEHGLRSEFIIYMRQRIQEHYALHLLHYHSAHWVFNADTPNQTQGASPRAVSHQYYDFLNQVDLRHTNDYILINSYLQVYYLPTNANIPPKDQYYQLASIFQGEALLAARHDLLMYLLDAYGINESVEGLMRPFIKEYKGTKLADKVMERYNIQKRLSAGNAAPYFILPDESGKRISLKSLRGKVIYLQIGASWSRDCDREVSAFRRLQYHFADNPNLAFVYISLDEEEELWRKAIRKRGLEGIHLRAETGLLSQVAESYDVAALPSYYIIDKRGLMFKSYAPSPQSFEHLTTLLEQALRK